MLAIAFFVVAGVVVRHWLDGPRVEGRATPAVELYPALRTIFLRYFMSWLRPVGQ